MEVQLVPQGKVMFLLGMLNTVAGFCDQDSRKGNKNKASKNLRLIRSAFESLKCQGLAVFAGWDFIPRNIRKRIMEMPNLRFFSNTNPFFFN
jgi:hypothetical protein